ncbi:uncharacterized protein V1516DRAFT_248818 [Lipomyces oligophaga]|uniref:uncharacterized protein n=1 Tax=Lipomyces oligophaga TaxID=45792 RepID=UPI0034CE0DAA
MDAQNQATLASMQSVLQFDPLPPRPRRSRKQFICCHCQARFKRGEHLTRHERTHTSERPFNCNACESTFSRKDLLVRHLRTCSAAQRQRSISTSAEVSSICSEKCSQPKDIKPESLKPTISSESEQSSKIGSDISKSAAADSAKSLASPSADQPADPSEIQDALLADNIMGQIPEIIPSPNLSFLLPAVNAYSPLPIIANDALSFDFSQYVNNLALSPSSAVALNSPQSTTDSISTSCARFNADQLSPSLTYRPVLRNSSESTGNESNLAEDWESGSSSVSFSESDPSSPATVWSDLLTEGLDFDLCDINRVSIFDEICRSNLVSLLGLIDDVPVIDADIGEFDKLNNLVDNQMLARNVLPQTDDMNLFLIAYKTGFGQQVPILHSTFCRFPFLRGTMEVLQDPSDSNSGPQIIALPSDFSTSSKAGSILVLAMACIGAMTLGANHAANTLCQLATNYVGAMVEDEGIFTQDEYLPLLQAKLLLCIFRAWGAPGARSLDQTIDELPFLSRCCAYGVPIRSDRVIDSWNGWVMREAYHRLYWAIFTFMSHLNIAYGQGMVMRITDHALPLPEFDSLWYAATENSWLELFATVSAPLTAEEAISKLNCDDTQLSKFGIQVLLHLIARSVVSSDSFLPISPSPTDLDNGAVSGAAGRRSSSSAQLDPSVLSTVSFAHIDRVTHQLLRLLLTMPNTRGRTSIEAIAHLIKLHRFSAATAFCTSHFRVLLCVPDPSAHLETLVPQFTSSMKRFRVQDDGGNATVHDMGIYSSIPYLRTLFEGATIGQRMRYGRLMSNSTASESVDIVLCLWAVSLAVVGWLYGVEKEGTKTMSVEEKFVFESIENLVLVAESKSQLYGTGLSHEQACAPVAAKLARLCAERFVGDIKWRVTQRMAMVLEYLADAM